MKKKKKKNVYTYNMYLFIGMHDMELIPGVRTSNKAAHGVGGHGEQGQEKLRKRDRWRELRNQLGIIIRWNLCVYQTVS